MNPIVITKPDAPDRVIRPYHVDAVSSYGEMACRIDLLDASQYFVETGLGFILREIYTSARAFPGEGRSVIAATDTVIETIAHRPPVPICETMVMQLVGTVLHCPFVSYNDTIRELGVGDAMFDTLMADVERRFAVRVDIQLDDHVWELQAAVKKAIRDSMMVAREEWVAVRRQDLENVVRDAKAPVRDTEDWGLHLQMAVNVLNKQQRPVASVLADKEKN